MNTLPPYTLALTPDEAQARFEMLQTRLTPLWHSIRAFNQDPQTIVVVPSLSLDLPVGGAILQAYEERYLFLLLLLRQPRARLIYVTSQPIRQEIVDYYLHLLPGVIASQARQRLFLVAPMDGSPRPLCEKLLERPPLLEHLRALILDHSRAHLVPYISTQIERDLALALDIPMYGADPKFFSFGTKSGCRRLFAEEGVKHPLGAENLHTEQEAIEALAGLRAQRPGLRQAVIKHNEGVSGLGNAIIDLQDLPAPGDAAEAKALARRLRAMRYEAASISFDWYMQTLAKHGGIVEERIMGDEFRSPSAQLRITPLGEVELLSTHDQLLGGPSGQSYLGAVFPADAAYAVKIMREAAKVGQRLAKEGVLGRFAIDFVAVRSGEGQEWDVYAIELNLRKGGTTHPFLTLQFLTDGVYDAEKGVFTTPFGQQKCFVASDHVESPLFRVFTPDDLFEIVALHGLHFDQARQTGIVLHMISALGESGHFGFTAVANSHAEARTLYDRAVAAFELEARQRLGQ